MNSPCWSNVALCLAVGMLTTADKKCGLGVADARIKSE